MTMHMEVVEQQHHEQHRRHPCSGAQLVYEPQSSATQAGNNNNSMTKPLVDFDVNEEAANCDVSMADQQATAAAAATSSVSSAAVRRRKRRSFFGGAKHHCQQQQLQPQAQQSPLAHKAAKRKSTASSGLLGAGGGGERRACLTEILWEDVQKAKELLGFRQKVASSTASTAAEPAQPPMQQHPVIARITHQAARFAPMAIFEDAENAQPPRSTVSLPRRTSRKHRRASSDLASTTAATVVDVESRDDATGAASRSHSPAASSAVVQTPRSPQHQRRVARFWELKRLIGELAARKADKSRQLAVLEAKEKSLSGDFGSCSGSLGHSAGGNNKDLAAQHQHCSQQQQEPSEHQQTSSGGSDGQLCFPTQYLVAVEAADSAQSQLLQLQEEVAVQRALVEANGRLLRECQTDRAARQLKRKRTQEYQRSQEKLRILSLRISELRARDSAADFAAASAETDSADTAASSTSGASEPGEQTWSRSLPALTSGSQHQHHQHLHLFRTQLADHRRLHSFRLPHGHQICAGAASAVSHAGSVDSGFQDMASNVTVMSAASSSYYCPSNGSVASLHFRPIDQDDDDDVEEEPEVSDEF